MRRLAIALVVIGAAVGGGASGVAGAMTGPAHHVKPGGTWTMNASGLLCEVQTFSKGHTWTGNGTSGADAGTFTGGGAHVNESWTSGQYEGSSFNGTYSKGTHQYQGAFQPAHGATYDAVLSQGTSC
jgi:hypothetical protein